MIKSLDTKDTKEYMIQTRKFDLMIFVRFSFVSFVSFVSKLQDLES
jgi:hypothetical protein